MLQEVVHKKMINMLGIRYTGRRPGGGGYTLPDFPDPESLVIPAVDDLSPWTPVWTMTITGSEYNTAYIERADLLLSDAEQTLPEDKVSALAMVTRKRSH